LNARLIQVLEEVKDSRREKSSSSERQQREESIHNDFITRSRDAYSPDRP